MAGSGWVVSPHSGGHKVPVAVQDKTRLRIQKHAEANYAGLFTRIDVRFKGAFCYVDAFTEPAPPSQGLLDARSESRDEYLTRLRDSPLHMVRLRYFAPERWSLAFYTYSHERYEPCDFNDGAWFGSVEDAFDIGAVYLQE